MWMNVLQMVIIVIPMLLVIMLLDLLPAYVILDTVVMGFPAMVSVFQSNVLHTLLQTIVNKHTASIP